MTTKHTPGPITKVQFFDSSGHVICEATGKRATEYKAGPDLLAALKRWQVFAHNNQWTDTDHHDADGTGWVSMTDAAIAKATGN